MCERNEVTPTNRNNKNMTEHIRTYVTWVHDTNQDVFHILFNLGLFEDVFNSTEYIVSKDSVIME